MRIAATAVFCLFLIASATHCQQPGLREITIESKWGGLGDSRNVKIVIESRNGVNHLGKVAITPELVDALLFSLSSPSLLTP